MEGKEEKSSIPGLTGTRWKDIVFAPPLYLVDEAKNMRRDVWKCAQIVPMVR